MALEALETLQSPHNVSGESASIEDLLSDVNEQSRAKQSKCQEWTSQTRAIDLSSLQKVTQGSFLPFFLSSFLSFFHFFPQRISFVFVFAIVNFSLYLSPCFIYFLLFFCLFCWSKYSDENSQRKEKEEEEEEEEEEKEKEEEGKRRTGPKIRSGSLEWK